MDAEEGLVLGCPDEGLSVVGLGVGVGVVLLVVLLEPPFVVVELPPAVELLSEIPSTALSLCSIRSVSGSNTRFLTIRINPPTIIPSNSIIAQKAGKQHNTESFFPFLVFLLLLELREESESRL